MTREEALAQLRNGPGINEDVSEEYNEAVDMAIKALEQETKIVPIAVIKFDDDILHEIVEEAVKNIEIEPKWIPVSERLPEREGWYLTSLGDKTYGGADVDMYCKGWVKYGTHVLAWMPLPEPYEPTN